MNLKKYIHRSLQIRNSIFQTNREWTLSMTLMQEMDFVVFILSKGRASTFLSQYIKWGGPSASSCWIIKHMHYAGWKEHEHIKLWWIIDNCFFNSSLEVSLLFSSAIIVILNPFLRLCCITKIISIQEKGHMDLCTAYNILQCCIKWIWSVPFGLSGISACWMCMLWNASFKDNWRQFKSFHKNMQAIESSLRKKTEHLS